MASKLKSKARLLMRGLRYREIFAYLDIDGWLRVEEAAQLYDLARGLPGKAPVVVEIGSWLGKSSMVLAKALSHKPGSELHCIDPFNSDGDAHSKPNYEKLSSELGETLLDRFRRTMQQSGVEDVVKVRQGYSHDFVKEFPEPVDMVFIDGDHSYEAVLQDFKDWAPLVKPGGILALHDVGRSASPGPGRVVDEQIKQNPEWTDQLQIRSLYVARRAMAAAVAS